MTALHFEGNGFEYFKIWIVNILLMIVTLGLYYPWAKVRNHRYFFANSTLEGQNFDYHATGKQLFIGYLISMVILILYVILQNIHLISSLVVAVIFLIALPWIIWRSMKFNMRVTSFSNVRFGFDGMLGGAYFNYMLLPIIFFVAIYVIPLAIVIFSSQQGITLGPLLTVIGFLILLPLAVYLLALIKKRNIKYMLDGSRYGQGQFSTEVEVAPFVIITLKTIGLSLLAFIGMMLVAGVIAWASGLGTHILQLAPNLQDPESINAIFQNPLITGLIGLVYIGFILIGILMLGYSYARQRAYIYDNTKLDNKIAFKSTLGARKFAFVLITNLLLVIVTLGLGTPWAKVRMARLLLQNTHADTSVGFESYLTQQQNEQSSLGDQIGDAFDVNVGMGL